MSECQFTEGELVSVKKLGCARVTAKFVRYYPKKDDCKLEVAPKQFLFAKLKYVSKLETETEAQRGQEESN